jgi:hypothetical protein
MSSNFGGYTVYVQDGVGRMIAQGHSDPGTNCSVHAALTSAIYSQEFADHVKKNYPHDLHSTFQLNIQICKETGKPK